MTIRRVFERPNTKIVLKASGKYDFILQSMTNALAMNAAAFNAISQQPIQNEYQVVLDFLFANRALVTQYGPRKFKPPPNIFYLS